MSEHIHEQISAFLDDELSAEESAFLVRRLSSDPLARQQTVRYATIGSVLREEAVLSGSHLLRDRIHAVLDGATVPLSATSTPAKRPMGWARMMAGGSVAAGVAIVALLGLRQINDSPVSAGADALPAAASAGAWSEPDSYVVPGDNSQATQVAPPPIWLTNYLIQHGSYTSTLNRTSVHSNVIGKRESDPTAEPADAGGEAQLP